MMGHDFDDDDDVSELLAAAQSSSMDNISPGMENDVADIGSYLSGGGGGGNAFGGDVFGGNAFGGSMSNFGGLGSSFNSPAPAQPSVSTEEKITEAVITGSKNFFSFVKDFISEVKGLSVFDLLKVGKRGIFSGLIFFVLGFITVFFKRNFGFQLMIASSLSEAISIVTFMLASDKIQKSHKGMLGDPMGNNTQQSNDLNAVSNDMGTEPALDFDFDLDMNSDMNSDMDLDDTKIADESDTSNSSFNFSEPSKSDFVQNSWLGSISEPVAPISAEPSLEPELKLDSVDVSLGVSRKRLFDIFQQRLHASEGKFWEPVVYTDLNSDVSKYWLKVINDAVYDSKPDGEAFVLVEVQESRLQTIVKAKYAKWLPKESTLQKNMLGVLSVDRKTSRKLGKNEIPTVEVVRSGPNIYFYVNYAVTLKPTLRDAFEFDAVQQYMLDENNLFPVVYGISSNGDFQFVDFKIVYSLIVSGPPRHGKSSLYTTILSQLFSFLSPKDLHCYFMDIKGGTSDFLTMLVPHAKQIECDPFRILLMMQSLMAECARRSALIGSDKNIFVYNRNHPDKKLPFLYLLGDEVSTLISMLHTYDSNHDTKYYAKFLYYLKTLAITYPNTGVRVFLAMHIVQDSEIPNGILNQFVYRFGVCLFNPNDQKRVLGGTVPENFKGPGDIALSYAGNLTSSHALLVEDEDNGQSIQNYFETIADVWSKLCPDEVDNSVLNPANISHISETVTIDTYVLDAELESKLNDPNFIDEGSEDTDGIDGADNNASEPSFKQSPVSSKIASVNPKSPVSSADSTVESTFDFDIDSSTFWGD